MADERPFNSKLHLAIRTSRPRITQSEMCERLRKKGYLIHSSDLSEIINAGKYSSPELKADIAKILNCEVSDIF